jgi:hypothetical protein
LEKSIAEAARVTCYTPNVTHLMPVPGRPRTGKQVLARISDLN